MKAVILPYLAVILAIALQVRGSGKQELAATEGRLAAALLVPKTKTTEQHRDHREWVAFSCLYQPSSTNILTLPWLHCRDVTTVI